MRLSHGKVWLIEKEWDSNGIVIGHNDNVIGTTTKREKKIVIGYNTLDRANEFCEQMNQECGNCPRRAALHTKYTVLPNYITVRYRYNEDSTARS